MEQSKAQRRFERIFANRMRPVGPDTETINKFRPSSAGMDVELKVKEEHNSRKSAHNSTAATLEQDNSKTPTVVETTTTDGVASYIRGEQASSSSELIGRFCLFSQVLKLNRRYMDDPGGYIWQEFFANKRIYSRQWKIYNVSTPDILANQSIVLVPYEQVQLLVDEINCKFTINEWTVPGYPFTVTFFNDHAPKPQFLGVCNIHTDLADLKAKIEPVPWAYGEVPTNASEAEKTDLDAFMVKCRDMLSIDQWKNKSTREKREKKQVQSVNGDLSTLQQAQQCLGLRPASAIKQSNPVVDLTQPAPCTPQNQPVLISIDVESYELDHSLITEIGVSTLDTQDFHDLAPGETGDSWIQKIRSRHFRIKGREHYINNLHCVGDADQFLFGRSEFITIEEAGVVVDSCFRPPFSAEFVCPRSLQLERNSNSNAHITNLAERSAALARVLENQEIADSADESRRVLLIGHDLTSDTTSLSRLSSRIFRQSVSSASSNDTDTTLTGTLDTATLYKHLTHTSQPRKLGAVCHDLDIVPWHPHNAGNDARYTLEVFLKIALRASQQQQQHTSNDDASSSRKQADGILKNVPKSEKAGVKEKNKFDIVKKHSRTSRDDFDSESVPDPCIRDSAPLFASRTLAPTGLNSVLDPSTSLHSSSQRTQDRDKRSDDEQTQLPIYREPGSDEEPY